MKKLSLNVKILIIVAVLVTGGTIVAYLGLSRMDLINGYLKDIVNIYVKRNQISSEMLDSAIVQLSFCKLLDLSIHS